MNATPQRRLTMFKMTVNGKTVAENKTQEEMVAVYVSYKFGALDKVRVTKDGKRVMISMYAGNVDVMVMP